MEKVIIFCWVLSIVFAIVFLFRAIYITLTKGANRKENVMDTEVRGDTIAVAVKVEAPLRISDGMLVKLQYTLSDKSGAIIEVKDDKTPLTYVHGNGEIVAGLERRLKGLRLGQRKKIVVPVDEAYGKYDPLAIKEVPKEIVPSEAIRIGAFVKEIGVDEKAGKILEVKDRTLIIDYNHPLAGKKLVFDVTVIDIRVASDHSIKDTKPAAATSVEDKSPRPHSPIA